jgi:uncharacterized protein YdhG (YjbR/CyaY superfamily)
MAKTTPPVDADSYIASQPARIQPILKKVRATIRKAAPKSRETIKYNIPTFEQNGHLFFFAAAKDHVGLYPRTAGIDRIKEVAKYARGAGTVRFPYDQPIPYALIAQMVKVRVVENMAKPGWGAKAGAKAEKEAAQSKSLKKKATKKKAAKKKSAAR